MYGVVRHCVRRFFDPFGFIHPYFISGCGPSHSTATGSGEDGALGVREVVENGLIRELDVYKDGKIVYLINHANVWYTATGGIRALDIMLSDLEEALLK